MSKLYLQNIINDISFENLPIKWQGFDFIRFSKDKTLFDFQKQALQNALKGLWFYFKDRKEDKQSLFVHYQANDFTENFDYDLKKKEGKKTAKYLLEYDKDYPAIDSKIPFAHFINRMSFWMATGSGKTLILVKLIEFLGKLIAEKELPARDILFLAHRDDLLDQFKNHVDEFNSFNFDTKINLKNLRDYESVKRENALPFVKNAITVFCYRSDLISDEHKEKIVNFQNYDNGGRWYILLDEAHKGDKEDSKRQILYSILSRNGFLFNFSATFIDPRDFATCVFNFNLSKFVEEGYGKHIYVSSAEISAFRGRGDFSPIEKQKIVLKTLLLLTYINKYFEKIRKVNNSLYHRPLLLTLVNSVDVEQSDLELFFRELEKVAKNEIRADLLKKAKEELVQEFRDNVKFVFEELECVINADLVLKLDYKDILKYVLNANTPGKIEVLKIPGNRQELIFRLMTAEKPFALIKIGDIAGWLKDKLEGYEINESFENESYFRRINRDDSDINVLMGSRSFYEGWDSNRPNLLLFVNIGVGSDAKKFVLQSVGRGVRIEPQKYQMKRLQNLFNAKEVKAQLFEKIKNLILVIESLFVFGTNAENLKEIIKTLKEEKQDRNLGEAFIINPDTQKYPLLVPVYKTAERIFAEEKEPQRYAVSKEDFELTSQFYEFLDDKIALVKYDCEVKVLKKTKESFGIKERYYDFSESSSLFDPELILERIFDYLGVKSRDFEKFKELEDEIVHFKKVRFSDGEKYEEIKLKIKEVRHYPERQKELDKQYGKIPRKEFERQMTLFEQAVIDWFKELGYEYKFGSDISTGGILVERDFKNVLLENRLRNAIKRLNLDLTEKAINETIWQLKKVEHPNLEIANREIYRMLTEGVKVEVENEKGELRGKLVKIFDFENPINNEFLIVNQFTVQGIEKTRRPDIVVFINGIPVAILELKNPRIEEATIQTAYQQLQEYKKDIPEIFRHNQVLIISDLAEAKYGTISSFWEWFKVWREIEGKDEKLKGVSELEVLIKGLFQKSRFLDIVENFIVFEADSEKDVSKFTKKICLYHQYFGVNKAVEATLKAIKPDRDRKIGVLWHTQGSGKTLSMIFYVNKIKQFKELQSPTFVFLTDRNDLDNQFYKTFLRTGYAVLAKQAETIKDLKEKLKTAGGELIFTTIQKFAEDFEILSERKNIIVIADEAHRSQYAELAGRARNCLPNASFMGITATPVSLEDRDTRLVFGDYIDVYPMSRSIKDGATVPIYYEGRLVPLHLTNYFIDEEFENLTEEVDFEMKESLKKKFAKLEEAVAAPDRLEKVAQDIVNHFNSRGLEGKAMIVTISRRVAVEMYKSILKIKDSPETAVVISKLEEFKEEIKEEIKIEEIEKRFKNPDDSLRMVIVCDMWITGFDAPALHTMYFDKPLKNHGLLQAIARVNRVFKDKQSGLIVDYIGIADDLKKALSIYNPEIKKEAMFPLQDIIDKMLEKYDIVKTMLQEVNYSKWKYSEGEKLAKILQQAVNTIITNPKDETLDQKRKERFLKESLQLIKLYAFAMPHKEAYEIKNDIDFFKALRDWLIKQTIVRNKIGIEIGLESTIKELVSKSIAAEGIIDIFSLKEKDKLDISILDEKFLEEAKKIKYKNLAIEILKKLLSDEISLRMRKNAIRYKSLLEILEKIIEEYEEKVISSSKVVERLIELAKEIKSLDKETKQMDLSEEELAFYDAIVSKKIVNQNGEIKKIVKELVKIIEKDLTIDWTNNEIINARIRDNARLLLLKNQFQPKEVEEITNLIYQQAFCLYKDYIPITVI